jgi:hypothetical protein
MDVLHLGPDLVRFRVLLQVQVERINADGKPPSIVSKLVLG